MPRAYPPAKYGKYYLQNMPFKVSEFWQNRLTPLREYVLLSALLVKTTISSLETLLNISAFKNSWKDTKLISFTPTSNAIKR